MKDVLDLAAQALRRGEIVAIPTESSYGLAVDALDEGALARLFAVKGRAPTEPVPILVPDEAALEELVVSIPDVARSLMARHWPGPLTIVLEARPEVPSLACGGTGKIGVRVPGPCPAAELLRLFRRPMTATSANASGQPPTTRDDEVRRTFGPSIGVIVPGKAPGGPPSTVVDATETPIRILRRGSVRIEEGR
ncbi:MAG: threonylcarbamoyl-AMP synthase [Deltaproteobacteria bacterium]|nr:threonylcarbamoyl-AMP synthase [Deltaproteobacteria bacterium]